MLGKTLKRGLAAALLVLIIIMPALAQPTKAPPTDAELTQHQLQALSADLTFTQALVRRLSAELAASEARAKWAVGKLWHLPDAITNDGGTAPKQ